MKTISRHEFNTLCNILQPYTKYIEEMRNQAKEDQEKYILKIKAKNADTVRRKSSYASVSSPQAYYDNAIHSDSTSRRNSNESTLLSKSNSIYEPDHEHHLEGPRAEKDYPIHLSVNSLIQEETEEDSNISSHQLHQEELERESTRSANQNHQEGNPSISTKNSASNLLSKAQEHSFMCSLKDQCNAPSIIPLEEVVIHSNNESQDIDPALSNEVIPCDESSSSSEGEEEINNDAIDYNQMGGSSYISTSYQNNFFPNSYIESLQQSNLCQENSTRTETNTTNDLMDQRNLSVSTLQSIQSESQSTQTCNDKSMFFSLHFHQ